MCIQLNINNNTITLSNSNFENFVNKDESIINFSSFFKFIEYIKSMFTGKYSPGDYVALFHSLHTNPSSECDANDESIVNKLHTTVKIIDKLKNENKPIYFNLSLIEDNNYTSSKFKITLGNSYQEQMLCQYLKFQNDEDVKQLCSMYDLKKDNCFTFTMKKGNKNDSLRFENDFNNRLENFNLSRKVGIQQVEEHEDDTKLTDLNEETKKAMKHNECNILSRLDNNNNIQEVGIMASLLKQDNKIGADS